MEVLRQGVQLLTGILVSPMRAKSSPLLESSYQYDCTGVHGLTNLSSCGSNIVKMQQSEQILRNVVELRCLII